MIPHGKEGEWDAISLLQGHAFIDVGEETYIWYSHWDSEDKFRSQDIGLATIRRDGFGYLSRHDPDSPGHCVTTTLPATTDARRIWVNVDGVEAAHPLTVELLDGLDRALPGYSGADAAKVTTAGTQVPVAWPGGEGDADPRRGEFAIRLSFPESADARLYAVYVGQ